MAQTFNFEVADTSGSVALKKNQALIKQGYNKLEFGLADLAPGLYFLKIIGEGFQKTIKFVKT